MRYVKEKNNKARNISAVLIVLSLAVFLLSNYAAYPAMFQLISLFTAVVGIQMLVRYVLSQHVYIIDDHENGTSDLIVIKKQGRREEKVCHLSLSCVTHVFSGDNKEAEDIKIHRSYNYAENIFPDVITLLYADGEKTVAVKLEADERFFQAIRQRAGGSADGEITFAM